MLSPPLRRLLSVLLVTLACLLTVWPGPFAQGALGHPLSDLADHYWGAWHFGERLLAGELPLRTEITHLPEGGRIWHIDPVGAALVTLLRPLGMPVAWNLMLTLQVLAAGLAGYGLARSVTGQELPAVGAGVVTGASPYAVSLLHSGLSEYLGLAAPVLFVWAWLRCLRTGTGWVWAALALALCTLQAFYYGAFGALLMLCFVPGRGGLSRLSAAARVLALWGVMAAPLLALMLSTMNAADAAFTSAQAPGWSLQRLPATDLLSWLHPGPWYHPDTPAMGNPGILHVNYLGWLAVSVGGLGLLSAAARPLRGAALTFMAFALGPAASFNRAPLTLAGLPVLLPLAALYLPGSPFNLVHHPYRMVALALPLLGLLVAFGLQRLPRPVAAALLPLMLFEALRVSPAPWPVQVTPVQLSPTYSAMQRPGAVLDLPPDASAGGRRYMLAQVSHRRPIAAGVNAFLSPTLRRDPLVARSLRALDDPNARARNRDVPHSGPVILPATGGESQLHALGFSYVLLHLDLLSAREAGRLKALLTAELGAPIAEDPVLLVYEVPALPTG